MMTNGFAGNVLRLMAGVAMVFLLFSCDDEQFNKGDLSEVRTLTPEEKFLIQSSNEFAMNLLEETRGENSENFLISPINASMTLGIIGNAGSEESYEAFREKMHLPKFTDMEVNKAFYEVRTLLPLVDPSVKISFATSVWSNYDLSSNANFYNKVLAYFETDIMEFREEKSIDKKQIDKWLVTKTQNESISLQTFDPNSNFRIINYSSFGGRMFDGLSTLQITYPFSGVDGDEKKITMNFYQEIPVNVSQKEGALHLEIPIGNSNYLLKVMMPYDNVDETNLSSTTSTPNLAIANVLIPDIRTSTELSLNRKLKEFEAEEYLYEALSSAFGHRDIQPQLASIHKSVLHIEGKKLNATPIPFEELQFEGDVLAINRPFYYLVKEKNTDLIVFGGKYIYPN